MRMQTIIIRYIETVADGLGEVSHILGTESYENISETLIPALPAARPAKAPHPVFLTKRFLHIEHHVWRLEDIEIVPSDGSAAAVFSIYITRHCVSKEEFLYQTLKKNPAVSINRLLRQGTLVEVDYGFVQQTAQSTAMLKSNKRYMDTLLNAEMHKRRLAVVVKVISRNLVQVVPVTSQPAAPGDRSSFRLDQSTVDKMPRYKHSGKDCHVICSMLESVSIQRVLPPASYFKNSTGRNPNYSVALSRNEIRMLKQSLMHAVGAPDYVPLKDMLVARETVQELEQRMARMSEQLQVCQIRLDQLMLIERLAIRWSEELGRCFSEEVRFQHDLERENRLG
jgi:uncharacterized protein YifN (PemK superfamily)